MDSAEDNALTHPDRCVVQSQLKMHAHTLTAVSDFPSPKLSTLVKGVHFEKGPTGGASNIGQY